MSRRLPSRYARHARCSSSVSQRGSDFTSAAMAANVPTPSTPTHRVAGACGRARGTGRCFLDGLHDLVVVQPGIAVEPRVLGRLSDVHHGQDTVVPVGEELLVERVGVEPGHRTGGQPGRAYADD